MKKFIATGAGFYGSRIDRGATFVAPDDFQASWAKPDDGAAFDPDSEAEEPGFLDRSIPDILVDLPNLDDQALRQALDAEVSGKTRKSLIAAIEDEITNRVGQVDENEDLKLVGTHAEIDKIAADEGVTFDPETKTVSAKVEAVIAARAEAKELLA